MQCDSPGPRGLDEPCHDLPVFGWGDPNRSDRYYRTGSIQKSFKASSEHHIDLVDLGFRRRVLASLLPASDDANRDRVCRLVGIGDCSDNGCCLGLGQAGAGPSSTYWNDPHHGRRDRNQCIFKIGDTRRVPRAELLSGKINVHQVPIADNPSLAIESGLALSDPHSSAERCQ